MENNNIIKFETNKKKEEVFSEELVSITLKHGSNIQSGGRVELDLFNNGTFIDCFIASIEEVHILPAETLVIMRVLFERPVNTKNKRPRKSLSFN